ncbi:MAG TPA: D-alanine--D-alanine ligase [Chromatiaceae bacterium]|jgi:D-alanine-D-alanine ligase|nr:D-alanine--D-alanine ligase [Chromatiaceae bacterium]HIA09453.1 D-alanine--D-alanine ligase [Chromatiaceae bacterium]HIN82148.1 D-alanine--D-alanine ligase [Chromatiales bacterium]HIO54974.1 D-alanine--D-alanine ligase [Chromatiales bacterium]
MSHVQQAQDFGRVAVLMGGLSAERDISLVSGTAVYEALCRREVDAHSVDVDASIVSTLENGNFDRAFIVLHGRGGEDGTIQGALETLGLPYTGSNVLGSAVAMHKLVCKRVWQGAGLATPACVVLEPGIDLQAVLDELNGRVMVKPVSEGSSIGMASASSVEELHQAWKDAAKYDETVFAEQWISGTEYTVAVLQSDVLPAIRLQTPNEFYDFEAKYQSDATEYRCPCGLDADAETALATLSLKAYQEVGASGWGRVDLMVDGDNKAWLIEINTVPGMTDHSLVPMAARAAGIEFDELVWRILETAQ